MKKMLRCPCRIRQGGQPGIWLRDGRKGCAADLPGLKGISNGNCLLNPAFCRMDEGSYFNRAVQPYRLFFNISCI